MVPFVFLEIVTDTPDNSVSVNLTETIHSEAAFSIKVEVLFRWSGVNVVFFLDVDQPNIPSVDHNWPTRGPNNPEWSLSRVAEGLDRIS